ncbi:MAG: lysylphosphatidylglycerol synthase transmembrane domain-containing protein [Gemmatimonadetes bacterium]|nr:lysylphosphatidylglycerol synthase transmembrane domain-containing protein [Gemmatimonadota bacterium]
MKRALNTLLKLAVSAGLLYYLALQTDLEGLGAAFAATVPSLFLLAVAFFVVSNGLGACQWYLLLRAHRLPIGFRQATVFYLTGVFFNNVLLGNIGGDALRIYDVRRLTGRTSGAAAATFMDRFVGLLSTCTLALIACFAVAEVRVPGVISVLVPVWAALILLMAMGLSGRVGRLLEGLATRILPERAGRKAASLRRSMAVYRNKGRLLLGVWAVSLGVQFARVLVYWSAGLAAGLHTGLIYFVAFQPVAAVIAALPISIGGLGVRENIFVELFGSVGAPESRAFAMSLLGYAAGVVASLLGGIAFVVRRVQRANARDS